MPRDLARTKPQDTDGQESGLEEFAPSTVRSRVTKEVDNSPIQSGWSVERRVQVKGDKPIQFKVPDDGEEVLIAFLQDRPFASFYQHWVKQEKGNRRPYICLGKGCPLCDRGDRPKSQDWFNVIELVNSELSGKGIELPRLALWYSSADPTEKIKERADTKRTAPINKDGQYFAVSKRTGKNGFNTYSVDPVKSDELSEDWGVTPLESGQLSEFAAKAYTSELVKPNTKAELQDVAEEYFSD